METVTRATLRIMGHSDRAYTLADLLDVFADAEQRTAFCYAERECPGYDGRADDFDTLTNTNEPIFTRLAENE